MACGKNFKEFGNVGRESHCKHYLLILGEVRRPENLSKWKPKRHAVKDYQGLTVALVCCILAKNFSTSYTYPDILSKVEWIKKQRIN